MADTFSYVKPQKATFTCKTKTLSYSFFIFHLHAKPKKAMEKKGKRNGKNGNVEKKNQIHQSLLF